MIIKVLIIGTILRCSILTAIFLLIHFIFSIFFKNAWKRDFLYISIQNRYSFFTITLPFFLRKLNHSNKSKIFPSFINHMYARSILGLEICSIAELNFSYMTIIVNKILSERMLKIRLKTLKTAPDNSWKKKKEKNPRRLMLFHQKKKIYKSS